MLLWLCMILVVVTTCHWAALINVSSWIMVSLVFGFVGGCVLDGTNLEIWDFCLAQSLVLFPFSLPKFKNFLFSSLNSKAPWTDILYLCSSEESHDEISDSLRPSRYPFVFSELRSFCELQRNQYKYYIRSQQEPSRSNLFKQILRKFWISRWLRITVGINSRIGGGGFFQFDANSRADEERPSPSPWQQADHPPTFGAVPPNFRFKRRWWFRTLPATTSLYWRRLETAILHPPNSITYYMHIIDR